MAETSVQPNNKVVVFKGRAQHEPKPGKLPKHVRHAAKRGLISDAQLKKLQGA